ncbi:MAG: SUMF1/EgtB/PvdO family nonheme iron enzyme [Candidatus Eremiobacterota bacterium]
MTVFCSNCGKQNTSDVKYCSSCGEQITHVTETGNLVTSVLLDNRYEITGLLKSGGMGSVYVAHDKRLEETCAVKEMFARFSSGEEQQYAVDRFKQEAKILARLRHKNLPVVKDYFVQHGRYYLIMDYVDGYDLETILNKEGSPGLGEEKVTAWAIEILDVLEYLHNQSPPIIYRDLKPANIMVRKEDSSVMLIDFGIARVLHPDNQSTQTKIGTPHYSAPEQFKGKPEIRSDLYSLAATMHHLLTGTLSTPCKFEPIRVINPSISVTIEEFLIKALQDHPDRRYSNASEMREALFRRKGAGDISTKPDTSITGPVPDRVSNYVDRLSQRKDGEDKTRERSDDFWHKNLKLPGKSFVQEFILIPAGDFLFGEEESIFQKVTAPFRKEKASTCPDDVKPKQRIYINSFYIDTYPVTNMEYKNFVTSTGYKSSGDWEKSFTEGKEHHPVVNVSWYDAQEYARWAGKRLLTEQEWEKAARWIDGRQWPWGNQQDYNRLNCKEGELKGTTPVRSFPEGKSYYGVFDMCGNIWEWTSSDYTPYGGNIKLNPKYASQLKVIRGGAWNSSIEQTRCFIRGSEDPANRFIDIGFRCGKNVV